MLDLEDAVGMSGFDEQVVRPKLYLIYNGPFPSNTYRPVAPRLPAVAESSVNTLLEAVSTGSVQGLYVMAMFDGFDYQSTWIPKDFPLSASPLNFDRDEMSRLFRVGYERGRSGGGWWSIEAPTESSELLKVIDPNEAFEMNDAYVQ